MSEREPQPANDPAREEAAAATLRTFLIADVRGYTRFTEEYGDEVGARLAERFALLARRGITEHGGELVELRGDEALGAFGSARDALRAAVELQRLFRTRTDGQPALSLGVGIGIDAGEAVPVEGGYRGGALNLAARLCSRARGGEILASETVASLARQVGGIRLEHRGTERLKGLGGAVKVVEVFPLVPLPPLPSVRLAWLRRFRRRHLTRRNLAAVALVAVVSAAGAAAVIATGAVSGTGPGAAATAGAGGTKRVALVLPRAPSGSDDMFAPYVDGLLDAKRQFGIETQTLTVDPSQGAVPEALRSKLSGVDLVLLGGPAVHDMFVNEVPRAPGTSFVFIDPTPEWDETQVHRFQNTADIFFIEGPASYLAAFMGVLMEKRRGLRRPIVSVVAGAPEVSENLVAGFQIGARKAVPGTVVLENYSNTFSNPSVCEAIANRQIDAGSRVVFAPAGACGQGALSAAAVRGVWGIGVDVDRSYLGPHILVSVVKRYERAVEFAVRSFLDGRLDGRTFEIGIERDAVGIVGISPEVPADIRRKVAKVAERKRKEWASWSTP